MKKYINDQKGITLVSLIVTVIVLIILAGISIGQIAGEKNSIDKTGDTTAFSELTKIQQAILERYIKYKQFGDANILIGEVLEYEDVQDALGQVNVNLKVEDLDGEENIEYQYYKLTKSNLEILGLTNIKNNDEYIVNYSSGEVFNFSKKNDSNNKPLYIYSKNLRQEP